jgi:hypothetical protein
MDKFERFMSRARAEWRAKRQGKKTASLWGFENWGREGTEGHHVGRGKFSDLLIDVPRSMHPELTRRQMEEHPPEGPDPNNPLERRGRVHAGLVDMHEALADGHRLARDCFLEAAKRGERDPRAVDIPKSLLDWLQRLADYLAKASKRALG